MESNDIVPDCQTVDLLLNDADDETTMQVSSIDGDVTKNSRKAAKKEKKSSVLLAPDGEEFDAKERHQLNLLMVNIIIWKYEIKYDCVPVS